MLLVKDILPERCRRGICLEKCLPTLPEVKTKKKRNGVSSVRGIRPDMYTDIFTGEEEGQDAYLESCKVLIVGYSCEPH